MKELCICLSWSSLFALQQQWCVVMKYSFTVHRISVSNTFNIILQFVTFSPALAPNGFQVLLGQNPHSAPYWKKCKRSVLIEKKERTELKLQKIWTMALFRQSHISHSLRNLSHLSQSSLLGNDRKHRIVEIRSVLSRSSCSPGTSRATLSPLPRTVSRCLLVSRGPRGFAWW